LERARSLSNGPIALSIIAILISLIVPILTLVQYLHTAPKVIATPHVASP
jgi:hypothetical protein